jgi:transcriptional regulator with AAA-type ATPase domain
MLWSSRTREAILGKRGWRDAARWPRGTRGGQPSPMHDRTVTETQLEFPARCERPKVPGVVVLFAGDVCAPAPRRLDAPFSVGRDATAGLVIEDRGISRVHATLEPTAGGALVTDHGSHNGTFVDGVRVTEPRVPAPFGALVRMARTLLLLTDDVLAFEAPAEPAHASLIGGPALADARLRIATIARSSDPVLVEGETGTGKEVVARILHEWSGRSGRLVDVNCAALPGELVESELFGHAKGSFSGSAAARPGLFRTAHGGTLLLDEIGELAPPIQAKLLRVIETGELRAVGEDTSTRVDVRLIAATNRDLDQMVAAGTFRGDLLHRIAAARIRLPPLEARREDIPLLAASFLAGTRQAMTAPALERLMRRDWPGNVRELRNVVRAAAGAAERAGRDQIHPDDVIMLDGEAASGEASMRARIVAALGAAGGNVTRAAREVGMARSGLYELLKRLKLDPSSFRRR